MRIFKHLLSYHYLTMVKSAKFIMPLICWITFILATYSMNPNYVVSTFMMTASVLYFIVVWLALIYVELLNPITEQLLLLKVRREHFYNASKLIFLFLFGSVLASVALVVPFISNILNSGAVFTRPITGYDYFCGYLLHIVTALLGAATGLFLAPRILQDRKLAVILTVGVALVAFVKIRIIEEISWLRFILWPFPPLADLAALFTDVETFSFKSLVFYVLLGGGYSLVLFSINTYLLKKRKFSS
ncbi:hypothetical protein AB6878_05690 [Carnobacterium maltaromaticum]|uniref:hypothetical protein n=1 Tax=Carnobacterium maltaromaticum TaxID=2751 RepID=UPI0039BDDA34